MRILLYIPLLALVACKQNEAPVEAPPVAAPTAIETTAQPMPPSLVEPARKANEIAVAQFSRIVLACKNGDRESIRDAQSVLQAAISDWGRVQGTDEEKAVNGACANMLVEAVSLGQSCLAAERMPDFEKKKVLDYTETGQACNALLDAVR